MTFFRRLPLLTCALMAACASPQGPAMHEVAAEINAVGVVGTRDVIAPGDVLAFQFAAIVELGQPNLSQQVIVQQDGSVTVVGVGTVDAAGYTPGQLTQALSERYTEVLGPDPLFAVTIAQQAPRRVHVLGSVGQPGSLLMPPDQRLTLVQALAEAGGVFSQKSYLGNTLLVRWDSERQGYVSWVIDARERWWGEEQAIFLRPGDVLYVPNTPVVEVNTWVDIWMRNMIPFPRIFVN